jgi:aerobic-type carbon monoxide dehydrogenase small subunit (CoxS/CutS family)
VTTIEGLREHPLVDAFVEADATQCGFCTPGQIVSASALLAANAHPSSDEVRHAMSGNLCRCGTYPKIERAIAAVAAREEGD